VDGPVGWGVGLEEGVGGRGEGAHGCYNGINCYNCKLVLCVAFTIILVKI